MPGFLVFSFPHPGGGVVCAAQMEKTEGVMEACLHSILINPPFCAE
jgi:hypothetical protein